MTEPLAVRLTDTESRADLGTFFARARRADPDGAARLVGHGDVLAAYVSPLHGPGLPTVIGMRTARLAEPWSGDVVAPLAALLDRLARQSAEPALPLPPVELASVSWAGVSPPRSGWERIGHVQPAVVAQSAATGIGEVAAGTPDGAGSAAVTRLRAAVWSRPASWSDGWSYPVPNGAAFAADALGFLQPAEQPPVTVFAAGAWLRLSSLAGHVLVRRPLLG